MAKEFFAFDNKELFHKYPKTLAVLLQLMFDESKINVRGGKVDDFDISPDTYDDLDEWFRDEYGITPEYFYDTKNYFEELLKSADYYVDDTGETYIQLSDYRIINDIESDIDDIAFGDLVYDAIGEFEEQTGIDIYTLGRMGRHVCVELTLENLINYNELKAECDRLQKELVSSANDYPAIDDYPLDESFGYDTSVDDPEIYEIDASLNGDIDFDKKIVNREELFDFVQRVADLYEDDAPENEILAISTFLGNYNIYISVTQSKMSKDIDDDTIYNIAREVVELYKDYDFYDFRDCYDSDDEGIFETASAIKDNNVDNIMIYLNFMIENEKGELRDRAENLVSRLKSHLNIDERLTEDLDDENDWIEVDSKYVYDSDGFMDDYTMYKNSDGTKYIFMFGDKDVYEPDKDYADWVCETEEEAYEWFDSYEGVYTDDDDFYANFPEGEDDSQEWLDDPDIGIFDFADEPLEEDKSLKESSWAEDIRPFTEITQNKLEVINNFNLFDDLCDEIYDKCESVVAVCIDEYRTLKPAYSRKTTPDSVKADKKLMFKIINDYYNKAGKSNENLEESVATAPIATYYVSGDLSILIYEINYDIDDEVIWAWSNTPDEIKNSVIEYEYGDNEFDSRAFFMADDEKVYLDQCLRSFHEDVDKSIAWTNLNGMEQQAVETAIDLVHSGEEVEDAVKQAISRCHDAMDDMDIEYGRIGETYEEEPIDEAKVIEYIKSRI